ncbi:MULTISPECIES: leucyl/phenylalanyl-tRNA--protein transferase [Weeksella]|uniref:Leucyl/phenylalanyl-tRNA--protein transferase n=1 Tax=Weeksella virosa (strain ATCC 43766 / DSM 16922 / JCM 21250 / CCUG 30538 / CDC 9751 / IAM 14551 / NBRC 16016 / NCTC 11634 / CL345/78) TaxID=865938 RepID=F0P2K5_WEEVC|nr:MULTISPECIES: leucyl/phenylalanyl-tRNA--protein transferase [Weeksella]ADX67844.1 Leucyl/phenylalanyl-tRNA--protein transferase [Weeksella virosa DSM 16922]MDK7374133.1 leucyl/phenylalanyl-tRNA--protein transferase [Weeksella virosa]OFM82811.1 leucyl/phenylalanyl-tRNA--protein transferase [Weeksella sp. HMSC059D05]VEH64529.1 Leucyl/phenylalanyl-tRNA--protein transferase [Weeksella virosa]
MIWLNSTDNYFPDYVHASEEGILAIGGDLSPERLLLAYSKGIFPWFNQEDPILWWFPPERFVLFPANLKVSKTMRKVFRNQQFHFTENLAFEQVIRLCAEIPRKNQDGTWLTEEMIEAYVELHRLGWAKSIEVWEEDTLVGGFYGIEVGRVFCGESMFSKVSNASKAGFIHFIATNFHEYDLIDCQVYTEHLESLGAEMISAETFLQYISK